MHGHKGYSSSAFLICLWTIEFVLISGECCIGKKRSDPLFARVLVIPTRECCKLFRVLKSFLVVFPTFGKRIFKTGKLNNATHERRRRSCFTFFMERSDQSFERVDLCTYCRSETV